MSIKTKPLWMLASDIHFKTHDLDRVVRAANWIASVPDTYKVSRAVICGDLLTTRSSQPTHVLSACYRFLNQLAGAVPHVNIILGNHDLAYRLDYSTSALEALAITRLAPYVTLHNEIGCHEWDGRRVFVMPFREDQDQIVRSVNNLDPEIAASTVGFGHLAINRAITQRHVVDPATGKAGPPVRYPGLTGVGGFAPLARTFTGHFHSHQTILQAANQQSGDLRGSVTYIGAPLQLTWADLFDVRRGVVLLDPETLEHQLICNPFAEGYIAVSAEDVLANRVRVEHVRGKHAMITGRVSGYGYVSARDRLVQLGARSVRDKKPFERESQFEIKGLGKTTLPIDVRNRPDRDGGQLSEEEAAAKRRALDIVGPSAAAGSRDLASLRMERKPVDLGGIVHEYVSSLKLGSALEDKQDILTAVGKQLLNIGGYPHDKSGSSVKYKDMLDPSAPPVLDPSNGASQNIFAAHPVSIEITNFLGVQGTIGLDFERHLHPGLNFVVGPNGAGKSTIIEALVWCQFGQCIREGLGVNDVVNDVVGKNCNVRLTFANGYSISRSRKHSKFQNRVIVEKDGVVQQRFEGSNTRSSQASINELLGIDFDTFIRTILLGNESTRSFLSASPLQKRQLTEAALGLGVLDGCADACNSMLSQVGEELDGQRSRLNAVTHTTLHLKTRIHRMAQTLRRLRDEAVSLDRELSDAEKKHARSVSEKRLKINGLRQHIQTEESFLDLEPDLLRLQKDVSNAQGRVENLGILSRFAQARLSVEHTGTDMRRKIKAASTQLDHLGEELEHLLGENDTLEVAVPPSKYDGVDEGKEGSSSVRELLTSIALGFRRFWVSLLNVISPGMGDRFGIPGKESPAVVEARRRWHDHVAAIFTLTSNVAKAEGRVKAIATAVGDLYRDVASQNSMSEGDVRAALRDLTLQGASDIPRQLAAAIGELKAATDRYDHLQRLYQSRKQTRLRRQRDLEEQEKQMDALMRNWEISLDRYHLMLVGREREIASHNEHLKSDIESLLDLNHQAVSLNRELAKTHSHREIFAFWQSALTRRQVAASKVTFRRYVTERHLGELNKLLGQILMVMYQDAHYARTVTTGTIGALFKEDGKEKEDDDGAARKSMSVLEPSLSINPALEYAKKSGGERKRVDLALFFALFMMGEARSAHMARYMLVDEAFDSLDVVGQAAVLKWCRWMTERLAYVFVITHSQSLLKLAEEEGAADGGITPNVVTVKGGNKGTELVITDAHSVTAGFNE